MTLDERITQALETLDIAANEEQERDIIRHAFLGYARSIIPEKKESGIFNPILNESWNNGFQSGFNTASAQILSRIEEDSK